MSEKDYLAVAETKSVQAHTSGPWTLTHVGGRNFAVQQFSIRGMFGKSANTYPIFNKSRGAIDGADIFCSPGDARLIAAALEGHEANKAALMVLCVLERANDWHPNMAKDIAFAIGACRAAIGKATGAV